MHLLLLEVRAEIQQEPTIEILPLSSWPRGYETLFMLNPTEHEIYPAHKC